MILLIIVFVFGLAAPAFAGNHECTGKGWGCRRGGGPREHVCRRHPEKCLEGGALLIEDG